MNKYHSWLNSMWQGQIVSASGIPVLCIYLVGACGVFLVSHWLLGCSGAWFVTLLMTDWLRRLKKLFFLLLSFCFSFSAVIHNTRFFLIAFSLSQKTYMLVINVRVVVNLFISPDLIILKAVYKYIRINLNPSKCMHMPMPIHVQHAALTLHVPVTFYPQQNII